jgi:hypothetical protein
MISDSSGAAAIIIGLRARPAGGGRGMSSSLAVRRCGGGAEGEEKSPE